jgi:hypothetical protein
MVRLRASLVRLRASIKNRVHALLTIEGVQPPKVSDLFGSLYLLFSSLNDSFLVAQHENHVIIPLYPLNHPKIR